METLRRISELVEENTVIAYRAISPNPLGVGRKTPADAIAVRRRAERLAAEQTRRQVGDEFWRQFRATRGGGAGRGRPRRTDKALRTIYADLDPHTPDTTDPSAE